MGKLLLRIADLRKKHKVTQQELADCIGVSFQTISKWETGVSMPDITILPLLADYFSVSTDQLLGLNRLMEKLIFQKGQPQKIFGIKNWNIFYGHEKIIGTMTMQVSLFHRYGKSINQFLC